MKMTVKMVLCAMALVAFPGCIGFGGDDSGAAATLRYDGSSSGQHSQTLECGDQGKIGGGGTILDGDVVITLRDASGTRLFQQTFDGEFELDAKTISGTSGEWNINAQRRSNDALLGDEFRGDYEFVVNC